MADVDRSDVGQLINDLMRPLYVHRMAYSRQNEPDGHGQGARLRVRKAEAETDRIVRAYVAAHPAGIRPGPPYDPDAPAPLADITEAEADAMYDDLATPYREQTDAEAAADEATWD